jgi:hypothetical protein
MDKSMMNSMSPSMSERLTKRYRSPTIGIVYLVLAVVLPSFIGPGLFICTTLFSPAALSSLFQTIDIIALGLFFLGVLALLFTVSLLRIRRIFQIVIGSALVIFLGYSGSLVLFVVSLGQALDAPYLTKNYILEGKSYCLAVTEGFKPSAHFSLYDQSGIFTSKVAESKTSYSAVGMMSVKHWPTQIPLEPTEGHAEPFTLLLHIPEKDECYFTGQNTCSDFPYQLEH